MSFSLENEHIQEWLLDLIRAGELGRIREVNATALLDIIQEISRAQSIEDALQSLMHGLHVLTGFQEYAILEPDRERQNLWVCRKSSHPEFTRSIWHPAEVFGRALLGESIALYRVSVVEEFKQQESELLALMDSALLFSINTKLTRRLLLLTQQGEHRFSVQSKEIVTRLRPITEQRLINLELEQKLCELAERRSDDLKISQTRMAAFIQISSDWFWEMDEELKISFVANPNHPDGERVPSLMIGLPVLELRSAQEKTRLNRWFTISRLLQQRQPITDFEFEIHLQGLEPEWIRVSAEPFYNDQGLFSGYRGVATDISHVMSQREELNQQLQQFSAKAQEQKKLVAQPAQLLAEKSRILVVDDHASSLMVTQLMLSNLGYEVVTEERGGQVLKRTDLDEFLAIFMVLDLPDLSSEDICTTLRTRKIQTPLLALLQIRDDESEQRIQKNRMQGSLEKPVRLNQLKSLLDELTVFDVSQ